MLRINMRSATLPFVTISENTNCDTVEKAVQRMSQGKAIEFCWLSFLFSTSGNYRSADREQKTGGKRRKPATRMSYGKGLTVKGELIRKLGDWGIC